jgi:hypothetical protein
MVNEIGEKIKLKKVKKAVKIKIFSIALALGSFMSVPSFASYLDLAKNFFNQLDQNHMELVTQFYDKNILFQDPVHKLQGVAAVRSYYEGLYKKVDSIRFEYGKSLEVQDTITLSWKMVLKSPAIQSAKEVTVEGVSFITFDGKEGKAIFHRDYFDMGEFVYERVPVLSTIIFYIKKRLAGNG